MVGAERIESVSLTLVVLFWAAEHGLPVCDALVLSALFRDLLYERACLCLPRPGGLLLLLLEVEQKARIVDCVLLVLLPQQVCAVGVAQVELLGVEEIGKRLLLSLAEPLGIDLHGRLELHLEPRDVLLRSEVVLVLLFAS